MPWAMAMMERQSGASRARKSEKADLAIYSRRAPCACCDQRLMLCSGIHAIDATAAHCFIYVLVWAGGDVAEQAMNRVHLAIAH